ncbi:regulatory protein GemA [Acinetobacter sp. NIPH 1958]|uniref:gp16 family protein n=1 Tax=Acinetobacter sp. NIPH 1958 TaxID=2923430 RepID=UPI001F4AE8E8|nr:regulatory protein GemA [Acinetobacter sp. NIPH 1958]MCH7357311.1 regulatory protein GemA [Acinetobacter sp. NIPH 1958]
MKFNKKANLIKLIHVAKTKLGLDDDVYRDILKSTTGKDSSKELNLAQLDAVLDRLKQLGFSVEPKNKDDFKNLASDSQSKLIRHLWIQLHESGQVKSGTEKSLAKFVENRVGVSALQFLSTQHADMVINHLRQWCKRCGIKRITLEA